ncbi:radical SAM protein [Arcobacter lacus]|uniref:Radical SAM core domain-containing protein n=1 Tax=Arcobacter lacus TaxID=1912876 RepID=A0ABX5JKH8_9BACT|nr:radical SAM protein [Arcobacter lacus]PUE67167.1 hypothetical protein B0175_03055 [Arcobacter lacus]
MNIKSVCIELSNQCPLKCLHCSTNALPNKHLFYNKGETERLVQTFISQKLEIVYLSGGEPLLSPYLPDMIKNLKNANIKTAIYSSGVIFGSKGLISVDSSYCNSLKFNGLDTIAFSIYSMNENVHENITKTKKSLYLLKNSVSNFIDAGINVEINFVPFSSNYKDLENIIIYCIENNIKTINIQKAIMQGRLIENSHIIMTPLEENEFIQTLCILTNKYKQLIDIIVSKLFDIKVDGILKSKYSAGMDEYYISIPYKEISGRKFRYLAQ